MDDRAAFQEILAESLARRRDWLERSQLPKLKSEFRIFQTTFSNLYSLFLKKGLLNEDPYKNEQKFDEIRLPDRGDFIETERTDQMSIRLSQFDSQLGFLLTYYDFSVDFLTLKRIKDLLGIIKYINWTRLSVTAADSNTKAVAGLCTALRVGNDVFTAGLVNDALTQLERSSRVIFKLMGNLSDYRRETYKLDIRLAFQSSFEAGGSNDEVIKRIKTSFVEIMGGQAFYPELINEILREDSSLNGQALRDDLLRRLMVSKEKTKIEAPVSFKTLLMEGFRALDFASFSLDDALRKLLANSLVLEEQDLGAFNKLVKIFRKLLNLKPKPLIYEVEFFDSIKGSSKTEKLDFYIFQAKAEREIRFLASLNNRSSNINKHFEEASEERLLDLLSKTLEGLKSIHRQMNGLDLFFKSEVPRPLRSKLRGIKPELSLIKKAIVKANQRRYEFIARKEEQEQLKRLGINDGQA